LNGTFATQHDTPKHITLVGKNWRKVSKKKHAWREAKIKQKKKKMQHNYLKSQRSIINKICKKGKSFPFLGSSCREIVARG
jgi:hypothetical protein